MKEKLSSLGLSLLTLIVVSLYPCLFQYSTNLPESRFRDAMLFFGIFLGLGLLMFLVLLAIFRRAETAGFFGGLCLLVVINFGLVKTGIQAHWPKFPGLILLMLFALVLGTLGLWVLRKKYRCRVPLVLLCLMFSSLCLVTVFMAVPQLIKNSSAGNPGGEDPAQQTTLEQADRPNVYYYIYDEYSGPEGLQYFYGFDNSAFYEALEQRGFACSRSSYNTESCSTVRLVPDLYDLSYHTEVYFVNGDGASPRLYRLFRDMGYQINLLSHNDFLDTDGARLVTTMQTEESVCRYLYQNSLLPNTPLSGLLEQMPQLRSVYQYERLLQEVLDAMEGAYDLTEGRPTLTLGYVQSPHTLFLYDGEGNRRPESQTQNWGDPQYYLGQLQYTNGRILTAVDRILAADPTAIIILQSDHGARLGYHLMELYGTPYDPETETIYQQNVLNCVYMGGKLLDIEGLSGVNTLRLVLNEVYGTDYEMLPEETGFINYYP